MVLNRNEREQLEGLFSTATLEKSHPWDGKYGTRPQRWIARLQDQWVMTSEYSDASRVIDVSTYRLGVDNDPSWKTRIANHLDATTPFAATMIEFKGHKLASYNYELRPGVYPMQTVAYGIWDPAVYADPQYCPAYDSTLDAAIDEEAIRKFYSKMASVFDGATFIGELRETVRMFKAPLRSLNKSIDTQIKHSRRLRQATVARAKREARQLAKGLTPIKRRRFVNRHVLREWRKAASSSFLEWSWGVKPLMTDIGDLFTALKQQLDAPYIEQFHAGASASQQRSVIPQRIVGAYSTICDATVDILMKTTITYRGAVYSRVDTSADTSSVLKVAPLDWVPTAYELMPHSWLLDYFTTLGDVINAVVTAQRLRYVFCNKTVRHWLQHDIKLSPRMNYKSIYPHQIKWEVYNPGRLVVRKKHVSRNPVGSVPIPSLTFSGPLSTAKVANLTAYASLKGEGGDFRNRNRL